MSDLLITVEQAAAELKLHPKTVLRHIRERRLAATRIGKGYRIARSSLDAFAGIARGIGGLRSAKTTCIVDVPEMTTERTERLASFLQSAALTGSAETPPLTVQTAFDPAAAAMKLVVIGAPGDVARLLEMVELQLGNQQ